MKKLFILRHAEAEANKGGKDFERRLTKGGFEDAQSLGRAMKNKNHAPQFVMCSSAARAQETLAGALESLPSPAIQYDKEMYHAARSDLFEIIRSFDDKYDSAMIVGHNPAVHELAAALAADEGAEKLAHGYPPGTLSVFECPRASWGDLQSGENRLLDLIEV